MTPFEIQQINIANSQLVLGIVNDMLIFLTLFFSVFVAWYPNSRWAKERRAAKIVEALLYDHFNSYLELPTIDFHTVSNEPSEEERIAIDILRRCKWTMSANLTSPILKMNVGIVTFSKSHEFYKAQYETRSLPHPKDKNAFRRFSRDLKE